MFLKNQLSFCHITGLTIINAMKSLISHYFLQLAYHSGHNCQFCKSDVMNLFPNNLNHLNYIKITVNSTIRQSVLSGLVNIMWIVATAASDKFPSVGKYWFISEWSKRGMQNELLSKVKKEGREESLNRYYIVLICLCSVSFASDVSKYGRYLPIFLITFLKSFGVL